MPDTSGYIPSINNNSNSQQMLDKIMASKNAKLELMNKDVSGIKEKKKVWDDLKVKSISLQNMAKKLYGFESPFEEKLAKSSDENAFSANVSKNVDIGEHTVEILNKAKAERIASKSLPKNYKVDAGNYSIMLGNEEIKINFSGGTVDKFADAIKKASGDRLKASITFDKTNSQILTIESVKTGAKNQITFNNDTTKKLFKSMDFFDEIPVYDKFVKLDKNLLTVLSNNKRGPTFIQDGILQINSSESFKVNLPEKIPYRDKLVMEVDLRSEELSKEDKNKAIPTGPHFSKLGDLNLFNIQVEGESAFTRIPPLSIPEETTPVNDDHYIKIITNKREIDLNELNVTNNNQTLKFDMKDIIKEDESIEGVVLTNRNTEKKIEVSNLHFFDEASKLKMKFKNELVPAEDASIVFDGIKITRDTNNINDIVKGLTLNVFDKTKKEERLMIDRNYEKIVGSITDFLKEFNNYVTLLNKESDSRPDASGKTGDFPGDYSLISLSSKLRTTMMNSYPTKYGTELSLLSQIGISTNESSGGFDKTKLNGILEVNEKKFIDQMTKYSDGVKELFGNDTNGDFIIDSGVGYEIDNILKSYNTRDIGFFDNREKDIDRQIQNKNTEIASYKDKMDQDQKKLKSDLMKMDKARQELEDNKNKFENFNKQ